MSVSLKHLNMSSALSKLSSMAEHLTPDTFLEALESFRPPDGAVLKNFQVNLFTYLHTHKMHSLIVVAEEFYSIPYGYSQICMMEARDVAQFDGTIDAISAEDMQHGAYTINPQQKIHTISNTTYTRLIALEKIRTSDRENLDGCINGVCNLINKPFRVIAMGDTWFPSKRNHALCRMFVGYICSILLAGMEEREKPLSKTELNLHRKVHMWYHQDQRHEDLTVLANIIGRLFTHYGALVEYQCVLLAMFLRLTGSQDDKVIEMTRSFTPDILVPIPKVFSDILVSYLHSVLVYSLDLPVAMCDSPDYINRFPVDEGARILQQALKVRHPRQLYNEDPEILGHKLSRWNPMQSVTNVNNVDELKKMMLTDLHDMLEAERVSGVMCSQIDTYFKTGVVNARLTNLLQAVDQVLMRDAFVDYRYNLYTRLFAHLEIEPEDSIPVALSYGYTPSLKIALPKYIAKTIGKYLMLICERHSLAYTVCTALNAKMADEPVSYEKVVNLEEIRKARNS